MRVGPTGLRPGEITGLKVKRLDLLRGKVEVAEALSEVDGALMWGTPKTHERRVVRLPRFLCDELAAYLADRSHEPDDLVFAAPRSGPIREHKLMERYFEPAAVRAGLGVRTIHRRGGEVLVTDLRIHDLRHTAASLLIREGASIKTLQKQLGYKDAVQTLNRYGHLYPDELDSLADRRPSQGAPRARPFGGGDGPNADRALPRRGPDRKSRRSVTCGCGGHEIPEREPSAPRRRSDGRL